MSRPVSIYGKKIQYFDMDMPLPITHDSSSFSPSSFSPLSSSLTRSVFHSRHGSLTKSIPDSTDHLMFFNSTHRLDLFAWCDRLSRLLVAVRTHLKSMHFHSFMPRLCIDRSTAAVTLGNSLRHHDACCYSLQNNRTALIAT